MISRERVKSKSKKVWKYLYLNQSWYDKKPYWFQFVRHSRSDKIPFQYDLADRVYKSGLPFEFKIRIYVIHMLILCEYIFNFNRRFNSRCNSPYKCKHPFYIKFIREKDSWKIDKRDFNDICNGNDDWNVSLHSSLTSLSRAY